MTQATCATCGAPLPGPELPCRYCAAGLPGAVSLTGMATALNANSDLVHQALPVLADELAEALPGRVAIQHGGLLGHSRSVKHLTVDLDDQVFEISANGGRAVATVGMQHRGVVLNHETVTLAEWLRQLSVALNAQLARQAATAPALQRLLGQPPA